MQPALDFDRDVNLPVSGRSPRARQASASGARRAAGDRGAVTLAYVALLREVGPMSDHEAARMLGRLVSSVNSVRNGLKSRVVPSGEYEETPWGTRRVKWRLA